MNSANTTASKDILLQEHNKQIQKIRTISKQVFSAAGGVKAEPPKAHRMLA
ncbi:hypothetical protein ACTHRH_25475 [Paenibacillus sp. SAFN-117]